MVKEYTAAIATWNEYMSVFKICQPCKAYNLLWNQEKQKDDKHARRKDRLLGNNNNNNNNDGDGEAQARYNCYDDAGYTNVNQCYKFETKTSLAVAEKEDLELASEQGSILLIKAYGNVYGQGGYFSKSELDLNVIYIVLAVLATVSVGTCVGCIARWCRRRRRDVQQVKMEGTTASCSLSETFYEGEIEFDDNDADTTISTCAKSRAGGGSRWDRLRRSKRRRITSK